MPAGGNGKSKKGEEEHDKKGPNVNLPDKTLYLAWRAGCAAGMRRQRRRFLGGGRGGDSGGSRGCVPSAECPWPHIGANMEWFVLTTQGLNIWHNMAETLSTNNGHPQQAGVEGMLRLLSALVHRRNTAASRTGRSEATSCEELTAAVEALRRFIRSHDAWSRLAGHWRCQRVFVFVEEVPRCDRTGAPVIPPETAFVRFFFVTYGQGNALSNLLWPLVALMAQAAWTSAGTGPPTSKRRRRGDSTGSDGDDPPGAQPGQAVLRGAAQSADVRLWKKEVDKVGGISDFAGLRRLFANYSRTPSIESAGHLTGAANPKRAHSELCLQEILSTATAAALEGAVFAKEVDEDGRRIKLLHTGLQDLRNPCYSGVFNAALGREVMYFPRPENVVEIEPFQMTEEGLLHWLFPFVAAELHSVVFPPPAAQQGRIGFVSEAIREREEVSPPVDGPVLDAAAAGAGAGGSDILSAAAGEEIELQQQLEMLQAAIQLPGGAGSSLLPMPSSDEGGAGMSPEPGASAAAREGDRRREQLRRDQQQHVYRKQVDKLLRQEEGTGFPRTREGLREWAAKAPWGTPRWACSPDRYRDCGGDPECMLRILFQYWKLSDALQAGRVCIGQHGTPAADAGDCFRNYLDLVEWCGDRYQHTCLDPNTRGQLLMNSRMFSYAKEHQLFDVPMEKNPYYPPSLGPDFPSECQAVAAFSANMFDVAGLVKDGGRIPLVLWVAVLSCHRRCPTESLLGDPADEVLNFNVFLLGRGGGGKSKAMNEILALGIPGLSIGVDQETNKARAGGNLISVIYFGDDVPLDAKTMDPEKLSTLKTLLSSGSVGVMEHVWKIHPDGSRHRLVRVIHNQHTGIMLICSNTPVNRVDEALLQRAMVFHQGQIRRSAPTETSKASAGEGTEWGRKKVTVHDAVQAGKLLPVDTERTRRFHRKCKFDQLVSTLIWGGIYTGPIRWNHVIPGLMWTELSNYMAENYGHRLNLRDEHRFTLMAQQVTIWGIIHRLYHGGGLLRGAPLHCKTLFPAVAQRAYTTEAATQITAFLMANQLCHTRWYEVVVGLRYHVEQLLRSNVLLYRPANDTLIVGQADEWRRRQLSHMALQAQAEDGYKWADTDDQLPAAVRKQIGQTLFLHEWNATRRQDGGNSLLVPHDALAKHWGTNAVVAGPQLATLPQELVGKDGALLSLWDANTLYIPGDLPTVARNVIAALQQLGHGNIPEVPEVLQVLRDMGNTMLSSRKMVLPFNNPALLPRMAPKGCVLYGKSTRPLVRLAERNLPFLPQVLSAAALATVPPDQLRVLARATTRRQPPGRTGATTAAAAAAAAAGGMTALQPRMMDLYAGDPKAFVNLLAANTSAAKGGCAVTRGTQAAVGINTALLLAKYDNPGKLVEGFMRNKWANKHSRPGTRIVQPGTLASPSTPGLLGVHIQERKCGKTRNLHTSGRSYSSLVYELGAGMSAEESGKTRPGMHNVAASMDEHALHQLWESLGGGRGSDDPAAAWERYRSDPACPLNDDQRVLDKWRAAMRPGIQPAVYPDHFVEAERRRFLAIHREHQRADRDTTGPAGAGGE